MKFITRSLALLLVASSFLLPQIVQAQPNDAAPAIVNPPDAQKAMDEAMKTMIDKFKKMTPQELRDYVRESQEEMWRSQMVRQGFNDLEIQEIVLNFLHQQDAARTDIRAVAARLRDALANTDATINTKTTPEQLTILLEELQKAADLEQKRRDKATTELYQTLKLDERSRLDATLHLRGIIGDEIWYLGDAFSGMGALGTLPVPEQKPEISAAELDKGAQLGLEMGKKFATMTPAQMRTYLQEAQERTLRAVLTANGFQDETVQNAILDFVHAQNSARSEIRLLAARLRDAAANPNADELQLQQLMAQLQSSNEQEIARRATATDGLQQTLDLQKNSRLNALLHLYGFIGDEAWNFADVLTSGSAIALLPTPAEIKVAPAK